MMRWVSNGQCLRRAGAAVCLLGLGCGSADAGRTLFEPPELPAPPPAPAEPVVMPLTPATPATSMEMTPTEMEPVNVPVNGSDDGVDDSMSAGDPPDVSPDPPAAQEPEPGSGCKPALGVSGAPQTISEAIILINTLPKPTTLACFLEALDRPLTLYMTKSDDSLQPSPGARSPRTFILRGNMELSVVLDGTARDTLEFGFRPESARSIKAEVLFPVSGSVSESSLFDRVQVTPRTTKCGACHVGEAHEEFPGFPLGVFASDVLEPFDLDEVSIEDMKAEAASCDSAAEPYRCGLISALFDHGDVVKGALIRPDQP